MKLTRRLTMIIGTSFLLPLVIMLFHLGVYEYNDEKHYFINNMNSSIEEASASLNTYMENITDKLKIQADNIILKQYFDNVNIKTLDYSMKDKIQLELNNIINLSDYILCINLIGLNNELLISTYPEIFQKYIDDESLDIINKTGEINFLTKFVIFNNVIAFESCAPIKDTNRNIIGYFSQIASIDHFNNILSMNNNNNGSYMFLEDLEGNIFSSESQNYLNKNNKWFNFKNEYNKKTIREISKESYGNNNYFEYVNSKNEPVIAVSRYIKKNDMFLVYATPKAFLFSSADRMGRIMIIYIFILIIVLAFIYRYIDKKIKKPFDEILKAIIYYENGIFSYTPSVKGGYELETTANALSSMAERIEKIHKTLGLSEKKYKIAMEFTNDVIFSSDIKKEKFYSDKDKWEKFFNLPYDYDTNKVVSNITSLIHNNDIDLYNDFIKKISYNIQENIENTVKVEFRIKKPNGLYMWIMETNILFKGIDDKITEIIGSFINIDDRKIKEEQASSDYLSKLLNRSSFSFEVNNILNKEKSINIALLFIDIDDFKSINDEFGHKIGDEVISFIGKTINQTIDQFDIACRYGGDEFAVCINDQTKAKQTAENILFGISKKFILREKKETLSVKCSIGIAMFPQHGKTMEDLLNNADRAMYLVKKNGKCGINIFDYI